MTDVEEKEEQVESSEETQEPLTLPSEEKEKSPLRPLGWTTLGLGVAVAIAGGITGGVTMSMGSELKENCEEGICSDEDWETHEKATNLATATNVLLPVGGALAIAGLVMIIAGSEKEEPVVRQTRPFVINVGIHF